MEEGKKLEKYRSDAGLVRYRIVGVNEGFDEMVLSVEKFSVIEDPYQIVK